MKFRTATLIAGSLVLLVQYIISAQGQTESNLEHAFTRGHSNPSHVLTLQTHDIESALDKRLSALANVVCHEKIARYSRNGATTNQLDTLEINVEVLNGIEKYSQIRKNQKNFPNMQKLPGTWSVGEMATLLRSTRDAIDIGDVQVGRDEVPDFGQASLMIFASPASSQRWYLNTRSRVHWLSFEGRVWTSNENNDIRRVSWIATNLPVETNVAQVLWTVDFSPVNLSSVIVSLPQRALYQVTYRKSAERVDYNVTNFSEYRRYGSDTAVHFEEQGAAEPRQSEK